MQYFMKRNLLMNCKIIGFDIHFAIMTLRAYFLKLFYIKYHYNQNSRYD